MSSNRDSSQVEDAQAPLSVAEFSKRQVAMIERQMLSATDLADLIDQSMTGIRQLSGGSQVEIWLHDPVEELAGQLVDEGAGGMIEINPKSKFHRFEQSEFDDMDSSEIATRLLSSLEQSLSAGT